MARADQRKFHYIYKITRNDGSGKYYIGMHSTDDLEDGYFGSGQLLWKSIAKHGKEMHSKEILEFLPSRQELKARERELVNEEIVNDPLCMNLKLGGEGGGKIWSEDHANRLAEGAAKSRVKIISEVNARATTEDRVERSKKRIETQRENGTLGQGFKGKKHSEETRRKIAESAKRRKVMGLSNGVTGFPCKEAV